MTLRDLILRVRALVVPGRVERELDEELAFHIERETHQQVANGLSPAEARTRALARFGSTPLVADECRDARGTAFVETLVRDVAYALRTFRRAPLAAITIVATIAVGLGLVAAVFTFFSLFFLRVDAVQNPEELFAVSRPADPGAEAAAPFTRADYEALRRETSVFADVVATVRGIETRIEAQVGGRPVSSIFVTGNYFQMLGVQAAMGRALGPGDDERGAVGPIVLSHRGWTRLFPADPTVIGRRVAINGVSCVVVGVMPEDFRGLAVAPPEYWAPLALAAEFRRADEGLEDERPVEIIGRLKPGVSATRAAAGLSTWWSQRAPATQAGDRPGSIALKPRQGTASDGGWLEIVAFSAPIFLAFGLILLIGCANVANLLLARGVARQREIGIRLALGASRRRIVRQLLTESFMLALASAACGYVVSRLILEGASYAVMTTMPAEIAEHVSFGVPAADWRVLAFLLVGAVCATVGFGLAPALRATRIEVVRATRGEISTHARPRRARDTLIAVQVGASALLLICAAVFLRSALAAALADPGIRTGDTIAVPIANEPRRAAVVREVTTHPSVTGVAATSSTARAEASSAGEVVPIDYRSVSPEFFDLLGIDLMRGRGFTKAERTADAGVAVVSDGAARRLWPSGEAVGQVIRLQPRPDTAPGASVPPARTVTVVGVARDVGGSVMFQMFSFSGVYLPADPLSPGTSLIVRVSGDPEQARLALIDRLTRVDPALDHEVNTLRTVAGMGAYVLKIAFWVTVILGGLALVVTVSGLFSVLSYLVEQRAREIGVRMALGATTRGVAALVLSQSIRPVGGGLLVGGGLAAGLAVLLMSAPATAEVGHTVRVLDPLAYVLSLLVIVTACALAAVIPTLRAARVDPIATLKNN